MFSLAQTADEATFLASLYTCIYIYIYVSRIWLTEDTYLRLIKSDTYFAVLLSIGTFSITGKKKFSRLLEIHKLRFLGLANWSNMGNCSGRICMYTKKGNNKEKVK